MGAIPGIDPPPCFSKVLILEGDKVVCFHTVLKVLILRGVGGAPWRRKDEYVIGVRQLAGRADRDSSQLSVDSLQSRLLLVPVAMSGSGESLGGRSGRGDCWNGTVGHVRGGGYPPLFLRMYGNDWTYGRMLRIYGDS